MWFTFAAATAVLWGLAELFYKKGAREDEQYSHLKTCICVGFVMGIHALFTLLTKGIDYHPINLIRYLPVSFLYIFSMALSFFGMRYIEESILGPIENTSGAICTILCVVFLGYELAWPTAVIIGIIVIGLLGIGFLEKFENPGRRERLGKKMAIISFAMPFAYALIDALGSFFDVFYLEMETTPLLNVTEETIEEVANTSYELTFFICAVILFIYLKIRKVKFEFPKQTDKIAAAVCETGGQLTYVYAMSGNGALAAPVISSVSIVALLLARVFLKEKLTWKQYLFIGIVIVGIIALAVVEGE